MDYREAGDRLTDEDEIEQFRVTLRSSYNGVRDWYSLLREEYKFIETLKRKGLEQYQYNKLDIEEPRAMYTRYEE